MFQRRFTLLTFRNVPIQADLSWILLLMLVMWSLTSSIFPTWYENLPLDDYWTMGMVGALGLLLSTILHEIAHISQAHARNIAPIRVLLTIFGGIPEENDDHSEPAAEWWTALAGPVANLSLALLLYGLMKVGEGKAWPDSIQGVMTFLLVINLVLGAGNLLPAMPLDGSRLLHSILWRWKQDRLKATEIAATVSASLGTMLLLAGVWLALTRSFMVALWWLLVGFFVRHSSRAALQKATIRKVLRGESLASFIHHNPITVPGDLTAVEFVRTFLLQHNQRQFPIVNPEGILLGCISPRNLTRIPQSLWDFRTVSELLTPCGEDETISLKDDALHALNLMNRAQKPFLLVVEQGKLIGEIHLKDLLEFLSARLEKEEESNAA